MGLDAFQTAQFKQRFSVYRFNKTTGTYAVVASNVPGYFETAPLQKRPASFFVDAQGTPLRDRDMLHCAIDANLTGSDCVLQTTGPDAGAWWDVHTYPKKRDGIAPKQIAEITRRDVAPEGV